MTYIHCLMSVARFCSLMLACLLLHCCAFCQVASVEGTLLYSTREEIPLKDSAGLFSIEEIKIVGNRITRDNIIHRELSFALHQQLPLNDLANELAESRKRLMNTGLFLDVVVTLSSLRGYEAYVTIELRERWYVYPVPFLKMVDRNFGQWVKEKDMDFNRVNYGIKFTHKNTTGRRDRSTLNFMHGYTKAVSFSYQGLFLDKAMKWSAGMGVAIGHNKELIYNTERNKQMAYKDNNDFVHSYFRGYAEVNYRPAIFTTHTFGFRYSQERIADTILAINPAYSFNNNRIRQPELYYNMAYFNVDFIPYPTKGFIANVLVQKKGFQRPLNMWQLNVKTSASWPLSEKSFFNLRTAGTVKLPFKQPYVNKSLIGNSDMFMQGYEYFVVDGVAGGYTKATLAHRLFSTNIGIPSERFRRLNHIPFKAYAKIFGNAGYVYNPQPGDNMLANRMLYSGGVGVDIITFYDFIIKLEWSFNQIGQNGLNLHRKDYF